MKHPFRITGPEMAAAGTLILALFVVALPQAVHVASSRHVASCANNLKQLGLVAKMYSSENRGGHYPPRDPRPNHWMMDMRAVYPNYVNDLNLFICPGSPLAHERTFHGRDTEQMLPQCVTPLFYTYSGFTMLNNEQALALFFALQENPELIHTPDMIRLPVPQNGSRRRTGPIGQAAIPMMWDRVSPIAEHFSHRRPLGGNILHMDGHVRFVEYSDANNTSFFPMTRLAAETYGWAVPPSPPGCEPY